MKKENYLKMVLSGLIFLAFVTSSAQEGGRFVYEFMNISNSARVSALGSNFLPIDDDDIDLVYANPSLINEHTSGQLSLNYLNYFPGTSSGFVSYGQHFKKIGSFAASLQYMNYGTFDEMDNAGQKIGEFNAGEYALIIGYSMPLSEKLRIGVNLKNIYSSLASYNSYGLAADIALSYSDREKLWSSTLIFKNMGRQITTYQDEEREDIPFQVQFGIAKKFEHAPFRLVFLFNNLQKWDLKYEDPLSKDNVDPFTGEKEEKSDFSKFGDNALRHLTVGAEFVPGKGNFMLRLGYNYRRRQEMKIADRTAMAGFSFGFGLKVYKLKIAYTRASYHLSGATNTISIATNMSSLFSSSAAN